MARSKKRNTVSSRSATRKSARIRHEKAPEVDVPSRPLTLRLPARQQPPAPITEEEGEESNPASQQNHTEDETEEEKDTDEEAYEPHEDEEEIQEQEQDGDEDEDEESQSQKGNKEEEVEDKEEEEEEEVSQKGHEEEEAEKREVSQKVQEEEEEESDLEEYIFVPQKRKAAPKTNSKQKNQKIQKPTKTVTKEKSPSPSLHDDSDAGEVIVPRISYTVVVLSAEELKKPASRRKPKSRMVEIASDLEWQDIYGRIKIVVCDLILPADAVVEDARFDMSWCIPRVQPQVLSLISAEDYTQLLKKALKMKEPGVKVLVEEKEQRLALDAQKENEPAAVPLAIPAPVVGPPPAVCDEHRARPPQKPAKSKPRKEADILPANVAINANIRQLRERWECNKTTCHSESCFIPAEGPHFPLSHDHLEKWAAAIAKGPEYATFESPPNIAQFDVVSTRAIASKSPILQARLNNMAKERGPQAPIVNVVLPNNFGVYQDYGIPHPHIVPAVGNHVAAGMANLPPVPSANALPIASGVRNATTNATGLIPAGYIEGEKMDLETFSTIFNLPENIVHRLKEQRITGTHAFIHMTDKDLDDMDFKLGEKIDLKEAIKIWAQGGDVESSSLSFC